MALEKHLTIGELRSALEKAKRVSSEHRAQACESLRSFASRDWSGESWENLQMEFDEQVGPVWVAADSAGTDVDEIAQLIRKREPLP